MAELGISGKSGEIMLNIFPNPCKGDTYLYTDDLEASYVRIINKEGRESGNWAISPGKTLHIQLQLSPGIYELVLLNQFGEPLGFSKSLYISEIH